MMEMAEEGQEQDDYRKIVALLAQLSSKESVQPAVVDLAALLSSTASGSKEGYDELVRELNSLTGRKVQRQEQAQQPRASSAGQLQVSLQKGARYEAEMSRQAGAVRGELEGAFKRLRQEPGKGVEVTGKGGDLVLPRLSLADQVEELGRIIDGLAQNAFSAEQLSIVGEELRGLEKAIRAAPANGAEGLLKLRDQRLAEATKLFGRLGGGVA